MKHGSKKTLLNTDFDMIRKFPCYCNLCEHESKACVQSNEAPMEKTWLKIDFEMFRKSLSCNLCEHESRACAQSKEASMKKARLKNRILKVLENLNSFKCFQIIVIDENVRNVTTNLITE